MKRTFTLAFILLSIVYTFGQQSWEKSYTDIVAQVFTQTLENKYILAGSEYDAMLQRWDIMQTDSNGNIEWQASLYKESDGRPNCLIATPDSGYLISGYNNANPYLLKFDKENSQEWEKEIELEQSGLSINDMLLIDNYYYGTGGGISSIDGGLFLTKMNLSGDTIWTKIYSEFGSGISVIKSYDDKFYCLSQRGSLVKFDSNGDTIWSVPLEDNFIANSIIKTTDKNLVVSGNGFIGNELIFAKVDSLGNNIWTKSISGNYPININCDIKESLNNELIAVNYMQTEQQDKSYMLLVSLDQNGDSIFSVENTSIELTPISIKQANDGFFVMLAKDKNGDPRLIKIISFEGLYSNIKDDEAENCRFDVYPNPTQGKLTLQSESSDINYIIKLMNLQGQPIVSNNFCTNLSTIDISHQPKGIYLLLIQGKDTQEIRKIVLE